MGLNYNSSVDQNPPNQAYVGPRNTAVIPPGGTITTLIARKGITTRLEILSRGAQTANQVLQFDTVANQGWLNGDTVFIMAPATTGGAGLTIIEDIAGNILCTWDANDPNGGMFVFGASVIAAGGLDFGAVIPGSSTGAGSETVEVFTQNTTAQSIANTGVAATLITWTDVTANPAWVPATGIFTAPKAGYYIFECTMNWAATAQALGALFVLSLLRNAATPYVVQWTQPVAALAQVHSETLSVGLRLAAGDTVAIQAALSGGTGANAFTATANQNTLSICQLTD